MGRALRPHHPGVPFHLTARIQGHDHLFCGLEPAVAELIRAAATTADGELLAFAVMPNHLHILYVQGSLPLSEFAQPMLTRAALLLRRRRGQEGHAFERRYQDSACTDAAYLRNAIAYIHLNPVRRGICTAPADYEWTSHREVTAVTERGTNGRAAWGALNALRMFSPEVGASTRDVVANYNAFLNWRIRMDAFRGSGAAERGERPPECPATRGGDQHWERVYGWAAARAAENAPSRRPVPDMRDLALRTLLDVAPDMSLDLLRGGSRAKPLVAVRNAFIVRALEHGHRGNRIARFLHVSPVTVSKQKRRRGL